MLLAARGFCYNRTRKGGIPMSARAYIEPGKIPPAVKELLETLRRGGFAAYPVGGCVRDLLMGLVPHDWDITTSARPDEIVAIAKSAE